MDCSPSALEKGTRRLRKGRFSGRSLVYHVSTATEARHPIFSEFRAARIVIQSINREDDALHVRTLAFVVMPDHIHWLFQLVGERDLSRCINNMKSFAARQINRQVGRNGRLWQKGFFDRAIRRDEDLASVARYIVANPVRAGLVSSVRDYSHWDAIWL